METIEIPVSEYNTMVQELKLLKNHVLLQKINQVVDLMYESKYGLYMGNYTDDLTEASLNNVSEWHISGDEWNEV